LVHGKAKWTSKTRSDSESIATALNWKTSLEPAKAIRPAASVVGSLQSRDRLRNSAAKLSLSNGLQYLPVLVVEEVEASIGSLVLANAGSTRLPIPATLPD
jgi:hypothetical protein